MNTKKIGVLLTNTGTPDAPTTSAVRRYLREFLSDKRVVQLPRLLWLPILYGLVLTVRPQRSAALYKKIWTQDGSPMRVIMQKTKEQLQKKLNEKNVNQFTFAIEIGMNYGNPSIQHGLENLRNQQVEHIIVLPLFPQYSHTTTASSFDRISNIVRKYPSLMDVTLVQQYATHHEYIHALAQSIQTVWNKTKPAEHLLISFHGIPERFVKNGDPYSSQCEQTAKLLAEELKLSHSQWTLCYQSQFGYDKWLTPSTQTLFAELPKRGIKNIDIVCPGFAIDCLETLEEISIRGKEIFIEAGGNTLRYIPALNDSEIHCLALTTILLEQINSCP